MNPETLRKIFQSSFDYKTYSQEIVHRVFGCNDVASRPELLDTNAEGDKSHFIGQMEDTDGRLLGFFYTRVADGGDVRRKRVGLRKLISPYLKYDVDGAIAIFDDGHHWRLSYICDLKEGNTSAKRFSYIMGDEKGQYKTPLERLERVAEMKGRYKLSDLREAFSVDALSKEFFNEYHDHYDIIVDELKRQGFEGATIHDYVKKMMGRIVFLHFLQKKRWLDNNPAFLRDLFFFSPHQSDFLEQVLEPLFFGIFNTESDQRENLFTNEHWDKGLLKQWVKLPYLNGGLFEKDEVDKQKIKLPASLFEDLFSFMASYNFTVDENDPDDAEIGVDPEMLGKIFESLLEDNKAKGAFYTPKEIVRYMCKESLIAYLSSQIGKSQSERKEQKENSDSSDGSDCDKYIRAFVETHEMQPELEPYRDALKSALREVKICDPAIGSGAFPMGLLNELWRCREALSNSSPKLGEGDRSEGMVEECVSRVDLKKEIIENNIYGVDIEKGAIDIARLRFWLSIVVDADTPEPLPNFDYKFMQGNSLVESFREHDLSHIMDNETVSNKRTTYQRRIDGKEIVQVSMDFSSEDTRRNLRIWLKKYFSLSNHHEKTEYRQRINESVKSYIRQQGVGTITEDSLNTLDPSANQDFFLWHTWFKDIFDKGGFDIVIGNPPYVEAKKLKYIASTLKNKYNVYSGTADLSIYFVEHGLNILSNNGILSLITTNKFFNTGYGKKLRSLIALKSIHKIINFEQVEVFEDVLVSSVIIEIAKEDVRRGNFFSYERFYKLKKEQFIPEFVSRQETWGSYSQDYLDEKEWSFSDMTELVLKGKIESGSQQLSDIKGISINRGVTTGYNPAFIISNEKKEYLINEDASNRSIIKNMLQGRNIRKWYYNESDENLLFIPWHFPLVDENISGASADAEYALMDRYPSIYKWLANYKDDLSARNQDETGIRYEWYALQRCAASYYKEFEYSEKIIWGLTADKWAFTIDKEQHYLPSNGYILTSTEIPISYVLGLLNSKLMHYYFHFIGIMTAGGAYTLKAATISALPFKIADDASQISSIVENILSIKEKDHNADVCELEHKIDQLVYSLYNLTPEEIAIIEKG